MTACSKCFLWKHLLRMDIHHWRWAARGDHDGFVLLAWFCSLSMPLIYRWNARTGKWQWWEVLPDNLRRAKEKGLEGNVCSLNLLRSLQGKKAWCINTFKKILHGIIWHPQVPLLTLTWEWNTTEAVVVEGLPSWDGSQRNSCGSEACAFLSLCPDRPVEESRGPNYRAEMSQIACSGLWRKSAQRFWKWCLKWCMIHGTWN